MRVSSYIGFIFVFSVSFNITNSYAESIEPKAASVLNSIEKQTKEKPTSPSTATTKIRGLVKPLREAVLSTDVIAKITHINVKEGDRFKQGEKLVQFECSRQRAQLKAAEAEVLAKKMISENNESLSTFNAVGSLELEVSKAQLDKAMAELEAIKIGNYFICSFRAPWNGRVTEIKANAHEVIEPGREIMKILDDKSLEVEMIVPSGWLKWIRPGIDISMAIDETGKNYDLEISRIGARVDPVSQTIRIFSSFKSDAADVLAGMSGAVIVNLPD